MRLQGIPTLQPHRATVVAPKEDLMDCTMCPGWMMGGGMVLGGVIALLLIVLLVLAIVRLTKS